MKVKEAKQITGHKSGLGKPSKMPRFSTSLSAYDCRLAVDWQRLRVLFVTRVMRLVATMLMTL